MTVWYLVIAVFLLVANGFFVAAEFALIAVRKTRLQQLAAGGNTRARLAQKSIQELSFMLSGVQLGITMASLGLGFVAEPAIAHLIEDALHSVAEIPAGLLHSISFVIALVIVVFFHMVIGEMAPKNIAIAEPEKTSLWLAIPLRIYVTVFRPFIWLLNWIANGGTRLVGVEPQDELVSAHTAEEIRGIVNESAEGGQLGRFKHRLLAGAIELAGRDAASVMVPRTEMTAVSLDATPVDIELIAIESGHSRIPIYRNDFDHIVGFFHAKDLLRVPPGERDQAVPRRLIRQMLVVPESRKLHPLLFDMRRQRRHFALVVDEHGGTAGVVTLEDLLEELVGEIRDEHDELELDVERISDDRMIVPGTMSIADLQNRLGVDVPEGDYETVAGFILDRLGRIPKRLDKVEHDEWVFRVQSMYRRRIVQVLIERAR